MQNYQLEHYLYARQYVHIGHDMKISKISKTSDYIKNIMIILIFSIFRYFRKYHDIFQPWLVGYVLDSDAACNTRHDWDEISLLTDECRGKWLIWQVRRDDVLHFVDQVLHVFQLGRQDVGGFLQLRSAA